ncbi:hypothetical protein TPHA_0C05020 [Tetrapisispora phaffii CBS 4417]|uniref:OPT family small oligopeptide transporter n=1 Tax=Tetrapisispora phaffii (strain ATCC 24235 / CBS 4417 / NBRC 1672 / NRRL Y-8282 / UCD 70-5) TaxID=1071381 RepID=G8BQY8_TETPH|nr:hypothetical protein TPHA_0C05020 [Tetrapisispora phaffii CBS 4417]CCE62650.1 hypothetical protein TPHA_0C05020 [Tetrapisispora phaffii CBS 4417]
MDDKKLETNIEEKELGNEGRAEQPGKLVEVSSDSFNEMGSINKNKTSTNIAVEGMYDTEDESLYEIELENVLEKMGYLDYENLTDVPESVKYIVSKVRTLSPEEGFDILKKAAVEFEGDPNIPELEYEELQKFGKAEDISQFNEIEIFELRTLAAMIKFHSPYKEVRAVVEATDDPNIPVETFRSYFLALLCAIVGSGFNEFFSHRVVTISVNTSVIQMFLYFFGKAWERYIPCWGISVKGRKYAINIDKPWTAKEQMFATLLFAICSGTFYTHYNILTQKVYYKEDVPFGYQFWLSLSVQFLGFGFAGILRRYVVYNPRALWPTVMTTLALNKALLDNKQDKGNGMSRYKFFFITFSAMFIYNWFPTYIINILNTFNWMTWISPQNLKLALITGGVSGLGFNPFPSFDWNVVSNVSPLIIPFYSNMTQFCGAFFAALVIIAVYFTNYKDCQYLPMFTNPLFTNKATVYEITNILNSDFKIDEKKYQEYSAPYYTAGNLVAYGSFIALYPLLIVYSFITDWELLSGAFGLWINSLWSFRSWNQWKKTFSKQYSAMDSYDDAHSNMMKNYAEVPDWWYFIILICSIIVAICVCEKYQTNTPIWALFVSIGFNFAFLIPLTILEATTGFSFGLNLLIEMIIGYALPGNPLALMLVKAFGYNIDGQADNYVSNLKMGHYSKIPPVALFRGQLIMVFIQIFVNLGVLNWSISNIKGFCTRTQSAKFTCPDAQTYYNASVVWGALGPKKIFNEVYPILRWCWLIGALIGLFFGIWRRFGSKYYPNWFNPVLFVGGMSNLSPPYGLMYFIPGIVVNWFSQYYMKRNHLRLWSKYNYILDSGFTSGLVLSAIIIFFAVQFKDTELSWWGNNVPYNGVDANTIPLRNVSALPRGYFGPELGHLP